MTGRYDATGSGVTQPRGAGDVAFAYATLLAARPEQATFSGVAREVLIDHTIQSIRHEALTNALSGKTYKKWGGGTWQASLETYSWAFAAHRLWNQLDTATRDLVRLVLTSEANILINKAIASGEEGDTGAEDNGWNSPTPALAAMMFPDDPNAPAWERTAKRLAINASSVTADATNTTLIDGTPVSEWVASVNLHPDFTLENHGFFNPIYQQVTQVDINDAAIAYGEAQKALPEAFSFRTLTIWQEVLSHLASDEGDLIMPAGQDWTSKDFQHLEYLGILATRLQRADASVFESRALGLVSRRQATHSNGSLLGQAQLGYESMLVKRLAATWWTHQMFGPSPQPTSSVFADQRKAATGVTNYVYSDFIAARLGQAFVSMSWDSAKPMGLVIPESEAYLSDPIFAYYAPLNLVGSASGAVGAHHCNCEPDRFSTAGSIGTRRFSMTAFADGATILLDRGDGTTFTYALEDIAGLTGVRSIGSAASEALGTLAGNWVNAADRLGMIVRGGAGISVAKVTGANNQVVITGSNGTGTGNRAAILLPNISHQRTLELEPYAQQLVTPADWSAASARGNDQSVRLAIARWAGPPMAQIALSDERGAPVPEEEATLAANTAQFTSHVGEAASYGETLRYFVQSDSALVAHQQTEDAAVVSNPNAADVKVNVTYAPAAGQPMTASRVLAEGEEALARVVAGELTLAGPELEVLLDAHAQLQQLAAQLPAINTKCHGRSHNLQREVTETQRDINAAVRAVDSAIAESKSPDPELRGEVRSIGRACHIVRQLVHHRHFSFLASDARQAWELAAQQVDSLLQKARTVSEQTDTWLVGKSLAQPGELLQLEFVIRNPGLRTLRDGTVTLTGPDGWVATEPVFAFDTLRPGNSTTVSLTIPVPLDALSGDEVQLVAQLDAYKDSHATSAFAQLDYVIDAALGVRPLVTTLPLARGGANQVPVQVVNYADHALDLSLQATGPAGVTVDNATQMVHLEPATSSNVTVLLRNTTNTSGSGQLNLVATTAAGATVASSLLLAYSDDLAQNTVGAPWPLGSATSNQSAYPPSLAFDGNASTFWVSAGTNSGEGPSTAKPVTLSVDFGVPQSIGTVVMVPRTSYGPKAYTIEMSNDATTWQQVASVPNAANGTITTPIAAISARYVRLQITGGWDRIQPPRNVQVASLIVRAPSP